VSPRIVGVVVTHVDGPRTSYIHREQLEAIMRPERYTELMDDLITACNEVVASGVTGVTPISDHQREAEG
jgi:hypothetical protein